MGRMVGIQTMGRMIQKGHYAWIEYQCSKCSDLHRLKYELIAEDDYNFIIHHNAVNVECALIRNQICVHQKARKIFNIYSLSLLAIKKYLENYADLIFTAKEGCIKVKFEVIK
jgi:hypothetical protein